MICVTKPTIEIKHLVRMLHQGNAQCYCLITKAYVAPDFLKVIVKSRPFNLGKHTYAAQNKLLTVTLHKELLPLYSVGLQQQNDVIPKQYTQTESKKVCF